MRYHETLAARFASKLVLDFLPATAASLIGGVVFAHYGLGRIPDAAARAEPASTEMMQLLRDEHGLIVSFMNAQLERDKTKLAAEDALRHGSSDAAAQPKIPMQTPIAPVASIAAKPNISHARQAATAPAALSAPMVIAQAQPSETANGAPRGPQLLIAKTIGLKDHVVSVTHRVVSTLGGIPGWLIGERWGGTDPKSHPAADAVAAS